MPVCLHKINITQFRNYAALRLDMKGAPIVVLSGENGTGKTNILEAVSLLSPGKGLRSADLLDMKSKQAGPEDAWGIAAELEKHDGERVKLGTGLVRKETEGAGRGESQVAFRDEQKIEKRRAVRIDGRDAKGHNELLDYLSIVWLTPQMDRLFLEGASSRRKFFDRLVYAYEPDHASRLNRYDKNLRERMKLLTQDRPADPVWLDSLETQLSAEAVAIAASRAGLLGKLEAGASQLEKRQSLFPSPVMMIEGWAEKEIGNRPALEIEETLKKRFRASRDADRFSGKSHEGVHRSDLAVFFKSKDMPAAQCSTGEQKALLVSILLSHAHLMRAEKGHTPILLLDEVCAHLDDARRGQLFAFLREMQGQVFLTGTDESIFAPLQGHALMLRTGNGTVRETQGANKQLAG